MSASGAVNWPPEAPVWNFRWEILDGDSEAIVFRDVLFRGKKVLHKASVPMIRVLNAVRRTCASISSTSASVRAPCLPDAPWRRSRRP